MACPYFYPIAPSADAQQPARAPLGVIHGGQCEKGGIAGADACNFGYARGRCISFPDSAAIDAVRFTVRQGKTVYVLEKDYLPIQHGTDLEILTEPVRRQAEVFTAWATR
jgi:hypothetical protein